MASMHTSLSGDETRGERDLYDIFRNYLPETYSVWHSKVLAVQPSREADFVIVHPRFGLWAIEVKDYSVDKIERADDKEMRIERRGVVKTEANPVHKAWMDSKMVKQLLADQPSLCHPTGPYQGELLLGHSYLGSAQQTPSIFQIRQLATECRSSFASWPS